MADLNASNMSISQGVNSGDQILDNGQYADLPMDTFEAEMNSDRTHVIEIYEEKNPYKQEIELKKLNPAKAGVKKETHEMGFYELEEKYNHYRKVAEQYEKLYGEYLEKFILSERDNKLLVFKQRRVNALIAKTAHLQAKWDTLNEEQKKIAVVAGASAGFLFIIWEFYVIFT